MAAALCAATTAHGAMGAGTITSSTRELVGGMVYTVQGNVSITGSAGQNGLTVKPNTGDNGKRVVIDIPEGASLTVKGAAGSGSTGGGAGVFLPGDMALYITGKGSLTAIGGAAAGGGNGASGGGAERNGWNFKNGGGGAGGAGGGGSGAGIGGNGGNGGSGGAGASQGNSRYASHGNDFPHNGDNGSGGSGGAAGAAGGSVYLLGDVAVTVRGGTAGAAGGSGVYGAYKQGTGADDWFSGGGGPGGGGGGGGASMSIGGGGGGGAGGGGGGSGSYLVVDDWDDPGNENLFIYDGQGVRIVDEWTIRGECGGAGGGGKPGGRGGDGKPESLDKGTKGGTGKSHKNYSETTSSSKAGDGGSGGNGGEQGAGGRLYVLPSVGFSASPYRASDALDATAFVNFLEVDVTLDLGLTDASGKPVTTTFKQPFAYGMKALDDIEVGGVNPRVQRAGYRFAGYWTTREGDGTCVYGPDYKPTMVMSPYTKDFTLYARWEVSPEILSVTSSGDAASALGVYGNTAITLRDAVQALVDNPLLVGTDGRRRVTFEKLDESNTVVRLAREIVVPEGVRSFEINGLYELEPGVMGVEIVAGPNSRHLNYVGKSSDEEAFSLTSLNFTGGNGAQGGSIRVTGEASLSIDTCSFVGNTSPGENSGGAIAVVSPGKGSELFVTSSTFAGNSAPARHGGALLVSGAYALFVNTTFTGNSVLGSGGAILEMGGGRIDTVNCTFAKNSSGSNSAIHSADQNAVIRAVNCIFADSAAVSLSGGTKNLFWCSENVASAQVFTSHGVAIPQVVAGVKHVIHPPLGGAAAGNEDAAEIYHDAGYNHIRAVGRDGREIVLDGNRDDAKIPFILDQLQSVRTAPTRGAVRLAVGTAPVTVELDGVLLDTAGRPRANETVPTQVTVAYSDGEAAPTDMVIKTAENGVFGLSVPVDGSDGLAHNVTGVKVDALGPDSIAVTMAPYALTAASAELLGSNDYVPLYGDAIAIGNVVAQSISATNSFDARAAGSFTAGELKGFGQIDLEHVAVAGGALDWMGGKLPAARSDAFANLAEMTVGGGADADAVGTISGSQTRSWKAAGDGFFQLQARCQNPANTTVKLELLDGNGSPVVEVTPEGALGNAYGMRRFLWTVPVRKGDSVRLAMSAGELTLVKGQFIYFGVPE